MAWSDDELADRWSSRPWRAEEAFDAFLERNPAFLDSRLLGLPGHAR